MIRMIFVAAGVWLTGQATPAILISIAAEEAAPQTAMSDVELIRELGAESFANREAAAHELVRRGDAAKPELTSVLDDPDLEIRLRVQQVLARIATSNLETRLAAFVDDVDGKHQHNLPAWKAFQDRLGGGREARELFADMIRFEAVFLEAVESESGELSADYNQRLKAIQANAIPGLDRTLSPASLATLLFVGGTDAVKIDTTAGYRFYSLLSQSSSDQAISSGPHSAAMKKLLSDWMLRSSQNGSLARNGLMLAQRYKLHDVGLTIARTLLAQKNVPSYVLPYAILAVGQFGDQGDSQLIEPLLTNATVCHSWHNPKFKEVIRIQVRDVALATTIHLQGKDPKEFGFDLLRKDPNSLFYVYTLGFPEPKLRDAALAKWKSWKQNANKDAGRS